MLLVVPSPGTSEMSEYFHRVVAAVRGTPSSAKLQARIQARIRQLDIELRVLQSRAAANATKLAAAKKRFAHTGVVDRLVAESILREKLQLDAQYQSTSKQLHDAQLQLRSLQGLKATEQTVTHQTEIAKVVQLLNRTTLSTKNVTAMTQGLKHEVAARERVKFVDEELQEAQEEQTADVDLDAYFDKEFNVMDRVISELDRVVSELPDITARVPNLKQETEAILFQNAQRRAQLNARVRPPYTR